MKEPIAVTAATAPDDASPEAAEVAARLSHAEEASQLTLVSERQVLSEVLTGRDADNAGRSGPGKVPNVSQTSGVASPVSEQVRALLCSQ